MGIYDRDYYQEEERRSFGGARFGGGRSVVINLILANVVIYVADLLFEQRISHLLALQSDLFRQPWMCWQLVTYGFVHSPDNIMHILFNMYFLWLFGTDVEPIYGKTEFLRVYLMATVLAGLAWVAFSTTSDRPATLIGASGAIMCVMILFVMHFPRRIFYLFLLIPVPAWALGVIYVLADVFGIEGGGTGNESVAHVAHLAGAAFGFIYYRAGLNLGRWVPSSLSLRSFRLKPRLRIHKPKDDHAELNKQVDSILEKISREGESSLTKSERRTLEEASRRYQRRRD